VAAPVQLAPVYAAVVVFVGYSLIYAVYTAFYRVLKSAIVECFQHSPAVASPELAYAGVLVAEASATISK
jgi:hypothetical protein